VISVGAALRLYNENLRQSVEAAVEKDGKEKI
jgi:hypothetical protein